MRWTLLGSGTSTGVPAIGCRCAVCRSSHPRNKRTRSSLSIRYQGRSIIIDTGVDLRQQVLREEIDRVDAVLFTHAHADHIYGLDEIRMYNLIQKAVIPCYGSAETLQRVQRAFSYIFSNKPSEGTKPQMTAFAIEGPFSLFGLPVQPISLLHGSMEVLGYRFGPAAYLTDCNQIPAHSLEKLKDLDLLIISAVGYQPHATHFNIGEALEIVRLLQPRRAFLTHLSHHFDYESVSTSLPAGVGLAYDGLQLEIPLAVEEKTLSAPPPAGAYR
ncbi:MAG: MBL fold metallo-hydrolase [Nitrospirae bacterium]|nr:MBL fold metallo-hydrolase [Candidatus Manganitrophaceae bacterium]